jgi:hypothetical protein
MQTAVTKRYAIDFCSCEAIYTAIQLFKKCTIWTVIKSLRNMEFKELNGENINSLTNVITFDTVVHKFLDRYAFSLKPCWCVAYFCIVRLGLTPCRLAKDGSNTEKIRK